jgi:hypothetical protein
MGTTGLMGIPTRAKVGSGPDTRLLVVVVRGTFLVLSLCAKTDIMGVQGNKQRSSTRIRMYVNEGGDFSC